MSQEPETDTLPLTAHSTLSGPAQRMRAHRERRRAGLRCVTVQLRETEVALLIQKKLLTPDARNDTRAIRDALHAYLDRTLSKAV